jgi:hypothetical protein
MSPCLKRVTGLEEVGTVAIKECPFVLELHIAYKHLSAIISVSVITQLIGMNEENTVLGTRGRLRWRSCSIWENEREYRQTKCTQKHRYGASVCTILYVTLFTHLL